MRKIIVLTVMLILTLGWHSEGMSPAQQLKGLCGQALADKVRELYAPGREPVAAMPPQWLGGGTATALIPVSWTGDKAPADAYNTVGASPEFIAARKDFVPAEVEKVLASGKGWKVGTASVGGSAFSAWTPDDDRRGDLARRLMYLAVMYPCALWHGQAPMLMADGQWPLLTAFGSKLLLQWHIADPVDPRESEEAASCGNRQLNSNPFVDMPLLALHIWGDRNTEGFEPPADRERAKLKAVYSRKADGQIDLYSPYVPDDAIWSLDGIVVNGESIDLAGVATGSHTLTFVSGKTHGRVKIKITD